MAKDPSREIMKAELASYGLTPASFLRALRDLEHWGLVEPVPKPKHKKIRAAKAAESGK